MSLHYRFFIAGALFALAGMFLGIYMGMKEDFTLAPVHAHINLVGWASLMLFGLYYRGNPAASARPLAQWQFWIAVLGMLLLVPGIAGAVTQNGSLAVLTIPGSLLTLISMLIFLWTLWQASRTHR